MFQYVQLYKQYETIQFICVMARGNSIFERSLFLFVFHMFQPLDLCMSKYSVNSVRMFVFIFM